MKHNVINLASLRLSFTLFSLTCIVRDFMVGNTFDRAATPEGSIRERNGVSARHFITPGGLPGDDETVTSVTAGATHRFYFCQKIQLGKKLSIIEEG
jgi:hypothetical protein